MRGEPLDAGTAAVHEHHVAALGVDLVEAGEHRTRVSDVLAARNAGRCKRFSRSFLARTRLWASMVAGVGYPVWLVRLLRLGRRTSPVSVRCSSATTSSICSRASRRSPRLRAVGGDLGFAGVDLGAVLGAFEVAPLRCQLVDAPVEAAHLSVKGVEDASEQALALVENWKTSGAAA